MFEIRRCHFSIPLLAGLIPFITVHATYFLSASEGYVPWCIPYIDSCTSISATGRHGTAFFTFKVLMIPSALIIMGYWLQAKERLEKLGCRERLIPALGIIGALFLILYTVALGAAGWHFRLQRHIGIIIYFCFTYLAQLLFLYRLEKLKIPDPTRLLQASLSCLLLGIGIGTLVMDLLLEDYDQYEDAFEWIIAFLLNSYFFISHWSWKNIDRFSRDRSEH